MWLQNTTPEKCLEEQVNLYFKAVQQNRLDDVKTILEFVKSIQNQIPIISNRRIVVNEFIQKKSGDTGLHVAASQGFLELLKYLVETEGGNVEQVNLDGKTALHDAAQFSQYEIVKYLLEKGSNVNVVKCADWTPLMLACTKQDDEVIRILLEHDAYPFFVNKDGWNCCHIASREGNPKIIEMILDCQSIESRRKLCKCKSRNGRRPLHTAVMHGHLEVAKLLIKEVNSDEANEEDHCGTTPVMEACRFGHLRLIQYLEENAQADLNGWNKQGLNCLHIAAEAGQCEVINLLAGKYGMDFNLGTEGDKMTALHWAAKEGQILAVKTLLDLGAGTQFQDSKGRTPKDVALIFGHTSVADLLLRNATTNS